MSYASIYNKVIELEKKINSLPISNEVFPTTTPDQYDSSLINRVQALESTSSALTNLSDRVSLIELKHSMPVVPNIQELIDRVESKLEPRLHLLESVQMPPDLSERMLIVESRQGVPNEVISSNLDNLLERVNKLELRFIPPDLSDRVLNIETDQNIAKIPILSDKIAILESNQFDQMRFASLENYVNELKNAHNDLQNKYNNLLALLPQIPQPEPPQPEPPQPEQ